jgi:uncharacterized protein YbgA (DUF1722 family)/uncharacterized protein YbbK (DUF523 family)
VRFDGGHARSPFVTDALGPSVEWVPVCPEMEAGLGTPRETIRLVTIDGTRRAVTTRSGQDVTPALQAAVDARVEALAGANLSGFVLKKDSPSCGVERVRVYTPAGARTRDGRGLFADALMRRLPLLPVEEEGRLGDPLLRDQFLNRVFGYQRLRAFFDGAWTISTLVGFHTAQKLTLLAHRPEGYRTLGRMVAGAATMPRADLTTTYQREYMAILAVPPTTGRHVNVLQHAAGYCSPHLDADDRRELHAAIADFATGIVPLVVPRTLCHHHARRQGHRWLLDQSYFEPYPKTLMPGAAPVMARR